METNQQQGVYTMSIEALSSHDVTKVKNVIDQGIKILQEIDDLRGGLKDTVKAIAEELDIKPALLNKAIKAAYKSNIEETKEIISDVEELLEVTGRR